MSNEEKFDKERLTRLKELAQKATPGEWKNPGRQLIVSNINKSEPVICDVIGDNIHNNISYIAAANPAAILELIADYERLEKEADWLAAAQNWDVPAEEPTRYPEGKTPPDGCIGVVDCVNCWRNAAREKVRRCEK